MPRILSQNTLMKHRRRDVSLSRQTSRTPQPSPRGSADLSPMSTWFASWSLDSGGSGTHQRRASDSSGSSTASPPESLPRIRRYPMSKTSSLDIRQVTRESVSSSTSRRRVIEPRAHAFERHDSWGQFVDVAEAEEQIVRHSMILSGRASQ